MTCGGCSSPRRMWGMQADPRLWPFAHSCVLLGLVSVHDHVQGGGGGGFRPGKISAQPNFEEQCMPNQAVTKTKVLNQKAGPGCAKNCTGKILAPIGQPKCSPAEPPHPFVRPSICTPATPDPHTGASGNTGSVRMGLTPRRPLPSQRGQGVGGDKASEADTHAWH